MGCFYCEQIPPPGTTVTLAADEAHHAGKVRRLRIGDRLGLIDGRGTAAQAVIESSLRDVLVLRVEQRQYHHPSTPSVCIASALPKGERQRVMFEMLAQLGVNGFIPLECERSVVRPVAGHHQRWLRFLRAGCKQSANPHFPEVGEFVRPEHLDRNENGLLLLADQDGEAMCTVAVTRVTVCIGPEGGFSPAERESLLAAGAKPVSLATHTLRTETACVVALAAIRNS